MKNISNQELDADKCTKCPTCGKSSWYVMLCDCGHYVCKHCTAEKADADSDITQIQCPKCGAVVLYV